MTYSIPSSTISRSPFVIITWGQVSYKEMIGAFVRLLTAISSILSLRESRPVISQSIQTRGPEANSRGFCIAECRFRMVGIPRGLQRRKWCDDGLVESVRYELRAVFRRAAVPKKSEELGDQNMQALGRRVSGWPLQFWTRPLACHNLEDYGTTSDPVRACLTVSHLPLVWRVLYWLQRTRLRRGHVLSITNRERIEWRGVGIGMR